MGDQNDLTNSLTQVYSTYLHKLNIGHSAELFLADFLNPERSNLKNLANIIEKNQAYAHFFFLTDLIQSRKEALLDSEADQAEKAPPPLDKIVQLFGKKGSRNAMLYLRALRTLGEGLPKAEGEIISLKPHDKFKRALSIEEYSEDNRLTHTEYNYFGGLLWDWLIMIMNQSKDTPKSSLEYVEKLWKDATPIALMAYHLGGALKTFELGHYAFSAGLCVLLGNLMMSLLYPNDPNWLNFVESQKALGFQIGSSCFQIKETKTFPIMHHELNSLLFASFYPLKKAEKAMYYLHEPYQLQKKYPNDYTLAVILNLAFELYLKKEAIPKVKEIKFLLTPAQRRWMTEIGLKETHLQLAFQQSYPTGKKA